MTAGASHEIVEKGITALVNLDHRGALGAEANTGDGAGILIQVPDRFLRAVVGFELPPEGHYATGIAFLPGPARADRRRRRGREDRRQRGPRASSAGATCRSTTRCSAPWPADVMPIVPPAVHRRAGRRRAPASTSSAGPTWCASGSSTRSAARTPTEGSSTSRASRARTLVYKGMLTTPQLREFFPDLRDERVESGLALVHSRFSTNTFPSWPLAHPYRYIAHNGEINTVQGNRNWMRAREALLESDLFARRPRAHLPDLHARAPATRPASTRCSSCCTSAAARCPTPC